MRFKINLTVFFLLCFAHNYAYPSPLNPTHPSPSKSTIAPSPNPTIAPSPNPKFAQSPNPTIIPSSPANDTLKNSLFRQIPQWMAENHVPCVGVGLIENGTIKWIKVFGNLKKGVPAPANTLFNITSQTKPVVAMVVLRLVANGNWDLDEPLAHYWIDPDIANDPYLGPPGRRIRT